MTDRDVVLVRSGLRPPALHFSNVHARHYGASFNFQGLPIVQGYISADVHTGSRDRVFSDAIGVQQRVADVRDRDVPPFDDCCRQRRPHA